MYSNKQRNLVRVCHPLIQIQDQRCHVMPDINFFEIAFTTIFVTNLSTCLAH